ncbi:conserved hypothetical protein [Gammaproteobacteria bacterium]
MPNVDITSLFAVVGITGITGWVAAFFSLRKDERATQIEQIIKERTKWRDDMRLLAKDIVLTHSDKKDSVLREATGHRSRLTTFLDPKCNHDNKILKEFDLLFNDENVSTQKFTKLIAILLKHDWEWAKWDCAPIYIKPFIRYTKRQRAWRSNDFRNIDG